MPPFVARHTPLELLEIVYVVSMHANPQAPTAVSGRVWDDHRAEAGFPDAPRAFSISRRLGVRWVDVLTAAHAAPADRWRRLAHLRADKGRKGLHLGVVLAALRQAAVRLNQPSIDRSDYTKAREMILNASRRTRHALVAARAVPELTQIEEILSRHNLSWEAALVKAGLQKPARTDNSGLSIEDGIKAFIEDTGSLPRHYEQLRLWARSRQVSLSFPRKTPGAVTQQAIRRVVAARAAAGLPKLEQAPRGSEFNAPSTQTEPQTIGPRARRPRWNRERLIAGLALAVEVLGPGHQLDQRSLKRIAATHGHLPIPSYSVVNRHLRRNYPDETWEQWRREAEARANHSR